MVYEYLSQLIGVYHDLSHVDGGVFHSFCHEKALEMLEIGEGVRILLDESR